MFISSAPSLKTAARLFAILRDTAQKGHSRQKSPLDYTWKCCHDSKGHYIHVQSKLLVTTVILYSENDNSSLSELY